MDPIIRIDHVSFSYGEASARALDDVTLSVSPGDFLGIIGPSGAGKTTLASAMSGAIPHHYTGPFFGNVLVDGKDTCAVTLTDISQIVGSVLQDIDTQMVASVVEDEMLFGLENFGVPHSQIEERVIDALETVGAISPRYPAGKSRKLPSPPSSPFGRASSFSTSPRRRSTPPARAWCSKPYAASIGSSASPWSSSSKRSRFSLNMRAASPSCRVDA